jgi:hypothetical protein
MKRKIRRVFAAIGNGLQAENAGEMISTRRKLEMLEETGHQDQASGQPGQTPDKNDAVTFYIVPSLIQHK